jgi:hypothetical protein
MNKIMHLSDELNDENDIITTDEEPSYELTKDEVKSLVDAFFYEWIPNDNILAKKVMIRMSNWLEEK